MSDRIRPSWNGIQSACKQLHSKYCDTYVNMPDCIVGLTRGGLIPGTMVSHLFDVPMIPVCYTSSVGNGSKSMYANKELQPINVKPANGSNLIVYIIDEICDTGHTLHEVSTYYMSLGYDVYTGVIHHRLDAIHYPTFCWAVLKESDPWVVYPWEVEE